MRTAIKQTLLLCGIALTLAAFPVFAQENSQDFRPDKTPFIEFGKFLKQKVEVDKVDLSQPFLIEFEGVISKDGKLDVKNSKFTRTEGDEKLLEIGKSFLEAVGDSQVLYYLQSLGVEKIIILLGQDENNMYFNLTSKQISPERARTVASGFKALLIMVRVLEKDKLDSDVLLLIDSIKADSRDNDFYLDFSSSKPKVHELIKKQLAVYSR